MSLRTVVLVPWICAAVAFGASAAASAHGPDTSSRDEHHMGPMSGYGMGPGMMAPGSGMGPGMMAPGYGMHPGMAGRGYGMGPGMMGPGYGMHPGMVGRGYGMGPGGMYQGYGMMQPLRQDLTAADVRHMMKHRLEWGGNPHIKVGKVEEKDDDTIVAEIVTEDGSLVDKLQVNRHTGWMQPVR